MNTEKMNRLSCLLVFTLSLATTTLTGCASLTGKKENSKDDSQSFLKPFSLLRQQKDDENSEPYPNPNKLAVAWTPDTLVQAGRTPTRGFGGRVFLYDENSRPVPVEGTLTIHGFDDAEESPEKRLKRFQFTPEQFTRHFSQSDLGASYSIWIPWDAVGGPLRHISLVASFQSQSGDIVQGAPATVVLPGRAAKSDETTVAKRSPQYQKFLDASLASSTSGLTTTTIKRRAKLDQQPIGPGISLPSMPGTSRGESDPASERIAQSPATPSMELGGSSSRGSAIQRSPSAPWNGFSPSKVLPASATERIEN